MEPGEGKDKASGARTAANSATASSPAGSSGPPNVIAFPGRGAGQVGFDRAELMRILDLYGRMVAAGQWRDYAMDFTKDAASFSAFRRTSERPQARVEKRPDLRGKQGMWTLFGEGGQVLKRGHDLAGVLFPIERRLVKLVSD